jgi:hypothetical protein
MKVATFFLAPISALLPTCNRKVVITHTGYGGNHKLAKWGSGDRNFGTHSSYDLKDDQIWTLECDHKEGYFYIVNTKYHPARLAKWGWGDQDTGTFTGGKFTDQLWKISGDESSGYTICNYKYSERCLAKWGRGDGEVGSYKNAADRWRITPLYSNPTLKWNRIEEIDNTRGQRPTVLTGFDWLLFLYEFKRYNSVKYEVGVSTSTTVSKSVEFGTELSLAVEPLGSMSSSFKFAIQTSTTNGKTEIHTKTTQFTVNAGENWWLCQGTATLDSWRGREDVQIISSQLAINSDLC